MRSLIRIAVVATAMLIAVPVMSVRAEAAPMAASGTTWTSVPVKRMPQRILAAWHKAFPKAKITKLETTGKGSTAQYRLTQSNAKKKKVIFNTAGKIVG